MPSLNKLFVVIDPTTDRQNALLNAEWIASQDSSISLHVYEAIFSVSDNNDEEALERVETKRHRDWLEQLVEPIRAAGNDVTVEVEWNGQWRDAIAPAAARSDADLIIKTATTHSGTGRRMLKTSDWILLRNAHCPVYLIKKDSIQIDTKILVALDIKRDDELHNQLNEKVIEFGKSLAKTTSGCSLHAVNAYASSDSFVYPDDVANKIGIASQEAHTIEGMPEEVIPEIAGAIDAGILVIGTAARDGIKAAVIGNTVEKILDAVDSNVMTVNAA
ncbi:MAG: universal stress protein [Gammaproteobacteria bacterium]|nr:universal stress protein [Gammaproteobacteria bacterium]MDD9958427.1 universal stress protein [Gammaproteobacteria bacterium]